MDTDTLTKEEGTPIKDIPTIPDKDQNLKDNKHNNHNNHNPIKIPIKTPNQE